MKLKKYKLGDIALINAGGDAPKNTTNTKTTNNYIPVYSNGIENEGLYGYTDKAKVFEKSITISARGTIGVSFKRNEPYVPIVRLLSVIPKKIVNLNYLYYKTKELKFKKDGSVQLQLTVPMLSDIDISLPDLETQRKIAAVLTALDDKIALNRRMNAKLEAMAKRLYDYWFVQFDFPDEQGRPYKSSGGKMVWNEQLKREIPEGWEVKRLGEVCKFENGDRSSNYPSGEEFVNRGIPFIAGGDIEGNTINRTTVRYISDDKFNSLRAGKALYKDILLTLRGSLAKCVYSPFNKCAIASALVIVRPKQCINNTFLYHLLTSDRINQLCNNHNNGSVQANLSVDVLSSFLQTFPKYNIIVKYEALSCKIDDKIMSNLQESARLVALRDRLLPLLMNGQVEVG